MSINDHPVDNRFDNGLPKIADAETKTAFARHCFLEYTAEHWNGSKLLEYFGTDFDSSTAEGFAATPGTDKRRLRSLLRSRGMFVARGRRTSVAKAYYDAAQNELDWHADDKECHSPHSYRQSHSPH